MKCRHTVAPVFALPKLNENGEPLRISWNNVMAKTFDSQSFRPAFAPQFRRDEYALLMIPNKDGVQRFWMAIWILILYEASFGNSAKTIPVVIEVRWLHDENEQQGGTPVHHVFELWGTFGRVKKGNSQRLWSIHCFLRSNYGGNQKLHRT